MIAIIGPTAVGKSQLALRLAQHFPLEIVSADSRQVYRYMDIGTSKPSQAERAAVPHHVIDVVEPDEAFSLAMYQRLATEALTAIREKGKLPMLVGGSGLYVWSLAEGWRIPQVAPNARLRRELEARAEREGSQRLYQELRDVDPVAAEKIDPNNVRRVIRALEIYRATGRPPSHLQLKEGLGLSVLLIGLSCARGELYRRIDSRVDLMIQNGLVEEVERLLKAGYSPTLPSMSGIGYKEIGRFLRGEMTLPEAIDKMKHETHRLARHQYAWFRLTDSRIHWFDVGEEEETSIDILEGVKDLIKGFIS